MNKLISAFLLSILTASLVPMVSFAASPNGGPGGGGGGGSTEPVGYDISYPQCGKRLPTDAHFGIVGVNGGTASKANSCLGDELVWANAALGGTNQPKVQLSVNTANPGEVIDQVTTWPTTPYDSNGNLPNNPYGNTCAGANDLACSWLYGWNRSIYTEGVFAAAATSMGLDSTTSHYVWWLDVETTNTWEVANTTDALQRNNAALEGFAGYYQSVGATVGLYSTAVQWASITGNYAGPTSNLNGLANWRPSGSTLSNAITNCSVAPLTPGGYISLTQYVVKNIDHDHSCI